MDGGPVQSGSRNLKSLGLVSLMLLCLMPFQNCGQSFKSTTLETKTDDDSSAKNRLSPEQLSIDPLFGEDMGPQEWLNSKPTLDVGVTPGVTPLSQLAYNTQGIYAAALSGPQIAFYKSEDKGATWNLPNGQLRSAGTNRAFRFLKLFGGSGTRIYMSTFSSRATNPTVDRQFDLEFSEDGGGLWSRIQTGQGEIWDLLEEPSQLHLLATPVQLEVGPQGQVVAPCVYLHSDARNINLVTKDSVRSIAPEYVSSEARCGKIFSRGNRIAYSFVLRQTKQNSDVVTSSHLRVSQNAGVDWVTLDLNQVLGGTQEWKISRDRFGTMIATSFDPAALAGEKKSLMKVSFDLGENWHNVQSLELSQLNASSVINSDYLGHLYVATSIEAGANQPVQRHTCRVNVPANTSPLTPLICETFLPMNSESDHGLLQDLMVVGKRVFWIGLSGTNNNRNEFTIRRFY